MLDHLAGAASGPKCFITKNARDFVTPTITSELAAFDCRLLTKFGDGLGYARNAIGG